MAPRPPLSVLFGSLRVRIAIVTLALVAVTAVAGTQLTRDRLRGARQAAARAEADVLARDLSADGAADWLHSPATLALATFAAIRAVIGLRVREAEEEFGLDISEHGMYGYPEQFIAAEAATNGNSPLGDGARA
jgi:hypothetical protein